MAKNLVIKTTLNNSEFDKKYQKLVKELSYAEEEQEKINNQTDKYKEQLDLNVQKQKELSDKIEETTSKIQQMNAIKEKDGILSSKEQQNLNNLTNQYNKLISKNETLSFQYDGLNAKIDGQNIKYQKSVDKVENIKNKIQELIDKSHKLDLNGFELNLKDIGKDLVENIKKVGKWAIAIFGIRTALSLITRATNTVSQYNDNLANKIESIKYTLAMSLEPIITRLVNWVYKLVQYVNYISEKWFGVSLFANAAAKSTAKAAKSAKDMKKSLQGYDTANVLQDNNSNSSAGSTGGIDAMKPLSELEVPNWIKWIADNKDIVLGFFIELATIIGIIKIAELVSKFSGLLTIFKGFSGLQIVGIIGGIALAITGLIQTISSIITFIKDPTWENFNNILIGITVTLAGAALAMIAFNATNPVGWIILAVDAVIALIAVLGSLIPKLFEDKAQILDTKEAQDQLTEAINNSKKATDSYIDAVDNAEEAEKRLAEAERKTGLSGEELFKQVQNGTLDYKNMNEAQREVYKAYLNNQDAQEKLKESSEELAKAKEEEKKASWENQLAIAKETENYDELKKSVVEAMEKGELSADEARDYIERAMTGTSKSFKDTFTKDLPDNIKEGLDPNRYESAFNKFKNKISEVWEGVKKGAKSAFDKVKSWFGFSSGGIVVDGEVTGFKSGGVVNQGKVIKLASGSIINNPGHGVPITRAIGGEAGAEGILPLTDEQAMAELGKQIGRWVTVNLSLNNYLDSRLLARIMEQINAENAFARNGV